MREGNKKITVHSPEFSIYIISYKRAEYMKTVNMLREGNYTGNWKIVLGNDDPTIDRYIKKFGEDRIRIYYKDEYIKKSIKIIKHKATPLYARNACYDIAIRDNVRYFLVLDDDYKYINYRYYPDGDKIKYDPHERLIVTDLNNVLNELLDFYVNTPSISLFAIAQSGDFVAGRKTFKGITAKRKVMNFIFHDTHRRVKYISTVNDDVNTYIYNGIRGKIMLTTNLLTVMQTTTQQTPAGITELYSELGTYSKAFSSVIIAPSAVRVSTVGHVAPRIHHKIFWKKTVPHIISEKYKKK